MNLDRDDLKIAQHLLAGWTEHLTNLEWGVTSTLPKNDFMENVRLTLLVRFYRGTAWVDRPTEEVDGNTVKDATATHVQPLRWVIRSY